MKTYLIVLAALCTYRIIKRVYPKFISWIFYDLLWTDRIGSPGYGYNSLGDFAKFQGNDLHNHKVKNIVIDRKWLKLIGLPKPI